MLFSRFIWSKEKINNNTPQLELPCLSQVIFTTLNTFFLSHQQWINILEALKFGLINLLDDTPAKLLMVLNCKAFSILTFLFCFSLFQNFTSSEEQNLLHFSELLSLLNPSVNINFSNKQNY